MSPDPDLSAGQLTFFWNSIVQDICIYVLPLPVVWKLNVLLRQKLALLFLFCIGFVALAGA